MSPSSVVSITMPSQYGTSRIAGVEHSIRTTRYTNTIHGADVDEHPVTEQFPPIWDDFVARRAASSDAVMLGCTGTSRSTAQLQVVAHLRNAPNRCIFPIVLVLCTDTSCLSPPWPICMMERRRHPRAFLACGACRPAGTNNIVCVIQCHQYIINTRGACPTIDLRNRPRT